MLLQNCSAGREFGMSEWYLPEGCRGAGETQGGPPGVARASHVTCVFIVPRQ